ncbi:hypothetical protein EVAR_57922_1, partial [Eumeta japonica]
CTESDGQHSAVVCVVKSVTFKPESAEIEQINRRSEFLTFQLSQIKPLSAVHFASSLTSLLSSLRLVPDQSGGLQSAPRSALTSRFLAGDAGLLHLGRRITNLAAVPRRLSATPSDPEVADSILKTDEHADEFVTEYL